MRRRGKLWAYTYKPFAYYAKNRDTKIFCNTDRQQKTLLAATSRASIKTTERSNSTMNPNIEQPTQLQIIKAHLQKGLPITSWQAIQDWHITRLGAHICELKKQGMDIKSQRIKNPKGGTYSKYWLETEGVA